MQIKPGVSIAGLRAEMLLGISIIGECLSRRGYECTLTAVTDGFHKPGSLHYLGLAADIRTRDIPSAELGEIKRELIQRLGAEFDVVLEPDHMHCEFQPKRNRA